METSNLTVQPTTIATPHWLARVIGPLTERRTYLETLDLVIDLAFGVTWFSVFTTLVATSAGLAVTLAGLPLLVATFHLARCAATIERRRATLLLGATFESAAPRVARPAG